MYYSDDEEEEDELINVNETFAKLQLQIDKQTKLIKKAKSKNNHGLAANLQNSNRGIRKDMEKLKESPLFDISKVNSIIREISKAAREKREANNNEKNEEKEEEQNEETLKKNEENEKNEENKETEEDDDMNIFGMFDDDGENQLPAENNIIKMELLDVKYKSWSGKSPFKLAEDTLRKRVGNNAKLIFEIVRKTPGYQGRIKIQCHDQSLNKKVIEDDYYYFETIEETKNYLGVKVLYTLNPNLNFNTLVPIPFRDLVGKWELKKVIITTYIYIYIYIF